MRLGVETAGPMLRRSAVTLLFGFVAGLSAQQATQPPAGGVEQDAVRAADATHGPPSVLRTEQPVEGLVRRGPESLALSLKPLSGPPADMVLHSFSFNGDPVATSKLHLRQLAPGVVEITSLAYSVGEWEFSVGDAGSSIYGTGERFDTLNRAHTIVRNASSDTPGVKGASTYKPIPFYMSTRGYGLWLDTTAEATFDFNVSHSTDVVVSLPSERLRVVLFTDARFPKMLEAFTKLTQRAVLPPPWAFAPWMGRDVHGSEAEVREDVERTRALGLPASVILIDSPWATAYNSYTINAKQFADAPGMVKGIHDAGFKLVLWHTPWINSASDTPGEPGFAGKMERHSPNYDEAASRGYFVKRPDGTPYIGRWWKGEGSLIDFTNPAAKIWWQDELRKVIRLNGLEGADGFKDDDGEGVYQGDVVFADKTPRELMRNRYSVLYNNAVEEVLQKDLKGNGVVLARSVSTGANGLGFLWGGDNEASFSEGNGLPTVVTAGLNAGMSGMPLWTADLGGYISSSVANDPMLLARWTEFAAFSPTMELLTTRNLQPWMWDAHAMGAGQDALDGATGVSNVAGGGMKLLDLYRRYAVLHMTLFPYRYAAAQESAATGMPLLRSLALLYQGDERAREARAEYLLGPDLLVAPVTDENTRRPVYVPDGRWVDFWTGEPVTGGQTLLREAPMETIPVFAHAGAILPELPADVMTLVPAAESGNQTVHTMDDRRVYEVVGADGGRVEVKDFEGRLLVREGRTLTIEGKPAQVTVRWRFGEARAVTLNGASVRVMTKDGSSSVAFSLSQRAVLSW